MHGVSTNAINQIMLLKRLSQKYLPMANRVYLTLIVKDDVLHLCL